MQDKAEKLTISVVRVPRAIVEQTKDSLLSFSLPGQLLEGIVYWAGIETDQGLFVTEAIVPRAAATPISFRVSALENARIITMLQAKGLQLIAQVHSHPNGVELTQSLSVPEVGFLPFEGFFSLVVKDYAVDGLLPFKEKVGIFYFQSGRFNRLTDSQREAYFRVVPHGIL